MTKFCKDCKWAKRTWSDLGGYEYAMCVHPETQKNPRTDTKYLVTGHRDGFLHCSNQRNFGKCGREGKLWEAKR